MDQNQMMLEYLMQMGELQPEQAAIARKQALVDQLRQGGATPGMRGNSRLQTAANPLEFLNSVGSNYLAQKGTNEIGTMSDKYGATRRQKLKDLNARMFPQPTLPEGPEQLSGPGMPGY